MESRRMRSRSQILKWICYVLALFVCAALQTTPGLFQLGQLPCMIQGIFGLPSLSSGGVPVLLSSLPACHQHPVRGKQL